MEAFAWPASLLFLGIAFMLLFKTPISRFIDRTQKVGKTGVEAGPAGQAQRPETEPSKVDDLIKLFDNKLIQQTEEVIKNDLTQRNLTSPEERERVLLRFLSAMFVASTFERTYWLITGSQLGAIQFVNSQASGAFIQVVQNWYDQAAEREPGLYKGWSFEQWLGFLEEIPLVQRNGDRLQITIQGREFLKYIVDRGFSLVKTG